jgi:hypothetical protein
LVGIAVAAGLLGLSAFYLERDRVAPTEAASSGRGMAPVPTLAASVAGDGVDPARAAVMEAPGDDRRSPEKCALSLDESCAFLSPDDETLRELTRCGIVRFDHPVSGDFDPQWLEMTGASEDEKKALAEAVDVFQTRLREQGAALAVEAGLDRAWAEQSNFLIVVGMVQTQVDADEQEASLLRIARERAGLEEAPADPTLIDRANRLLADSGDAFERVVAEKLGATRAHELRVAGDGWPGRRSHVGNRCRDLDPEPQPAGSKWVPKTRAEARNCMENWRDSGCRFLGPSDTLLEEMARCGAVRFDFPAFVMTRDADPTFDATFAGEVGLTPAEEAKIAEAVETFRANLYADVGKMVKSIGKSDEWAEQTPLMGLMMALHEEVEDEADIKAVFARIARERAGQLAPDPTDDIHEQFIRRITTLGDDLEATLAQTLGPDRAHSLREHTDGWPGNRVQTASQCE